MMNLPDKKLQYYGQWGGNPQGRKEDTSRCRYEVFPTTGFPIPHQCNQKEVMVIKGGFVSNMQNNIPLIIKNKERN